MIEVSDTPLHKAARQARSRASLEGLVAAAEAVLQRDGGADFSIAKVAAEAGVSVGGIYRRFQDKQQLLRAVKDRVLHRLERALEEGLTGAATPDLRSVVKTFVDTLLSAFEGRERLFLAIMDSAGDELLARRGREGMTFTDRLLERLKASSKLFADETTAPVLDPGRGRTKMGQLWAYARDDRPWNGPEPPGLAYVYAPDRKAERPTAHLKGFRGVLQVDGYAGYRALAEAGGIRLAFCWSHVRRRFYELAAAGPAPIATEALTYIGALYAIEVEIRGSSADERQAARQARSLPLIQALEPWLRAKLETVSQKTKLAEAIRYALSRWEGLSLFLHDGRIEIDNNTVERAMRPIALNRKNALFAGSDGGGEHWAVLASLVETCKLNGVEPEAYLADMLARLVNGHPQSRLDDLLPWAYVA